MATNQTSKVIEHLRRTVLQDGAGLSDGQLLGCFLESRDEGAFAALVKRHGPMVWGVCRRLLDHQDAEDAFQATFLVLVRKAAAIVPREMVANWLYGVAHQTALQARRTAARRRARERQVAQMPDPGAVQQDLSPDLQPLLDQELSRLPDKYRVLIVLCDLEGKTRKEVARQLGIPEGTVAGRLARARTMLARRLAHSGVVLSSAALGVVLAESVASAGVPAPVVSATIQAAGACAAGQAAEGVISAQVVSLTERVLKAMLLTRLKVATVVLLGLAVLGAGIGLSYHRLQAADAAPPAKELPAAADKKAEGLGKLKTARLAAAKKAYEAIWSEYEIGLHDEEFVYRWSIRVLESQRSSAEKQADQIKALEAHLERMKKMEKIAPDRSIFVPLERMQPDGGLKPGIRVDKDGKRQAFLQPLGPGLPHAVEATAFFRTEAELWLTEAKPRGAAK
jgi:RNA polymerase sigma factor (sigma-70 family)